MKSTLHLKFILLYIIFGFLSLFTLATLGKQLLWDKLVKTTSQNMYKEANLFATNYLPSYFSGDKTTWDVHSQLGVMKIYLDSSLWFVEADGTLITFSNLENTTAPQSIQDFDPAEIGGNQYVTGDYHGYFDEEVMTVMAPVIQGFSTKGYLLIHKPLSILEENCREILLPVYITFAVIFILSGIFVLGIHFFI